MAPQPTEIKEVAPCPNRTYIGDENDSVASEDSFDEIIHQSHEESEPLKESELKEKQVLKQPKKPLCTEKTVMRKSGIVVSEVGEYLIVESQTGQSLIGLDSWLFDGERNAVGYVVDVFGKVEKPYYAVKPQRTGKMGQEVYFAEGGCQIISEDDIKSMRSNTEMEADEDFSSDDQGTVNVATDPLRRTRMERTRPAERERTRDNVHMRHQHEQSKPHPQQFYAAHYQQMMKMHAQGYTPQVNPEGYIYHPRQEQNQFPFQAQNQFQFLGQPQFLSQGQTQFVSQNAFMPQNAFMAVNQFSPNPSMNLGASNYSAFEFPPRGNSDRK